MLLLFVAKFFICIAHYFFCFSIISLLCRPLHLAIIQENIPLTFYLVRLITGVHMNLDIANNMRQVHPPFFVHQCVSIHLFIDPFRLPFILL